MIFDIIGLAGVGLILLAYGMLQFGRITAEEPSYSLLNLFGAVLILVSLVVDFNVAAFAMESAWVVVSAFGLYRHRKKD